MVCYIVLLVCACRLGPLVRYWTMRYEAKHQHFKRLANSIGNFINICHTLAIRHQCYQCYYLTDNEAFQAQIQIGPEGNQTNVKLLILILLQLHHKKVIYKMFRGKEIHDAHIS